VKERPSTAWNKLKTAASFQRNSRFLPATFEDGIEDEYAGLTSPIPGSGKEPPVIPRGNGGAAARATAAAQNEFGRTRSRQFEFLFTENGHGDQESGIEIAAISTVAEPVSYVEDEIKKIPRVDFVTALPAELAIQILAHLDHKALRQTSLVSKRWHKTSQSQHVWREAFIREKSKAYAMSKPVQLGAGLGLPPFKPETDWKGLYRAKQRLERNWRAGDATPAYLNGHLDSIYCVQFDE
jgi:F-box and WD-40 domain protein 1/11